MHPKSISTTQKFTNKNAEFDILVRKFVDPKQTCRALKGEIEKYNKEDYPNLTIVFLGDYVDPYDFEGITRKEINSNN